MDKMKEQWYKAYELASSAIRPCVCSDKVKRSLKSSIESPYKIPTVLNSYGEYVGIKAWQVPKDIVKDNLELYANDPIYGILLLCKDYLVIDVDVEDKAVVDSIDALLPKTYYRYRDNSARRAYIYKKDFTLKKNIINLEKGCIEFLGDSQVCQIGGKHKTGYFVKWFPCFPMKQNIPVMTKEEFVTLYKKLSERLSGAPSTPIVLNPYTNKKHRLKYKDSETLAIIKSSAFISIDKDGKIFVKCPHEDQHKSPTNDTDACYFPKGYDGSTNSGFHCFHTSHGKISVKDFLASIGYIPPLVSASITTEGETLKAQVQNIRQNESLNESEKTNKILDLLLPNLDTRYNKNRDRYEIIKTLGNYKTLFTYFPPDLYYDIFTNTIHYNNRPPFKGYDIKLELDYEERFNFASSSNRTPIKAAVTDYLEDNKKDSLKEYFDHLKWDGINRIKDFHQKCLNLPRDDVSAKSYVYYLFTALAARGLGLRPIQADMILTLCGAQGIGKTTFVRELNPNPNWYRSINLFTSKEEKIRTAQGFFAIELAEISHLNDKLENEIKDFVTQVKDTWRPLYSDTTLTKNRRFILIGTSNHIHFLNDSTGNRRWLPLHIKKPIDTEYLRENRDQLYAEALELYKNKGLLYDKAAMFAAKEEYKYIIRDRWTYYVEDYIKENNSPDILHVETLLENLIGVKVSDMDSYKHLSRMYRVLKSLRYAPVEDNQNIFKKIDKENILEK